MMPVRRFNSIVWVLLLWVAFGCGSNSGWGASSDSFRSHWLEIIEASHNWHPDSVPVWGTSHSNVDIGGHIKCSEDTPATGWTTIFYSSSSKKYLHVNNCKSKIESKEFTRDFPYPPKSLPDSFIDTDRLARSVSRIAHGWNLQSCDFDATLRMVEEMATMDKDFPPESALWEVSLSCSGDVGGTIVVEASPGKILRKKRHSTKGE